MRLRDSVGQGFVAVADSGLAKDDHSSNVLNRSKDKDLSARIENQDGQLASEIGVWEMNHSDLKATHTFGDDKKVRPVTRTMTPAVQNNAFSYTFPAHSLTILRLRLK